MLFLLATAVLSALVVTISLRNVYAEVKPDVLLVADEFLPLTFKGGKIVQPADAYKKIDVDLGGKGREEDIFPIVLDTKHDAATFVPAGDKGLFILSDTIYSLSGGEIRRVSLATQADGLFTADEFTKMLNNAAGVVSSLVSVGLVVLSFLLYLLKAWLIALLLRLGQKLSKKEVLPQFLQLMRLSAVIVAVLEAFVLLLGQVSSLYLTNFQLFAIELLGATVILFRTGTFAENGVSENYKEETPKENDTEIKG